MIEIIPNWHPLLVHFTVALLPVATVFFLLGNTVKGRYADTWTQSAYWMLWVGVALSLLTVASGVVAFNSVNHDTPSHLAMIEHRNWALPTFLVYVVAGIWSLLIFRSGKNVNAAFLVLLVLAGLLLLSTAWHGGELVYRYGLGVMSLPKAEGDGHDHDHGQSHAHGGDGGAPGTEGNLEQNHADAVHHDSSDGHHDGEKAAHDNSDGHHDAEKTLHDNSDGHHDAEKTVHDNSDGHHHDPASPSAQEADHHDAQPHQH